MARLPATPIWYQEHGRRRQYRQNAKKWGVRVPKLPTVCLVETEMIAIPAWALEKALPGLKAPVGAVWLRRIAANVLAKLDRAEGGHPKVTATCFRRCTVCGRGLIGPDAEVRWEQDRAWEAGKMAEMKYDRDEAHKGCYNPTPCGPDCLERAEGLKKKRGRPRKQ
jgi:hypothetical protein